MPVNTLPLNVGLLPNAAVPIWIAFRSSAPLPAWVGRELSADVRKSEKVSLRNPIMPITDGFGG